MRTSSTASWGGDEERFFPHAGWGWDSQNYFQQAGWRFGRENYLPQAGLGWGRVNYFPQAGWGWDEKDFFSQCGWRWDEKDYLLQTGLGWDEEDFSPQSGWWWDGEDFFYRQAEDGMGRTTYLRQVEGGIGRTTTHRQAEGGMREFPPLLPSPSSLVVTNFLAIIVKRWQKEFFPACPLLDWTLIKAYSASIQRLFVYSVSVDLCVITCYGTLCPVKLSTLTVQKICHLSPFTFWGKKVHWLPIELKMFEPPPWFG